MLWCLLTQKSDFLTREQEDFSPLNLVVSFYSGFLCLGLWTTAVISGLWADMETAVNSSPATISSLGAASEPGLASAYICISIVLVLEEENAPR